MLACCWHKVELMISVLPVILCGGSGTRLWPLSRSAFPKQFLVFSGKNSLYQNAMQTEPENTPKTAMFHTDLRRSRTTPAMAPTTTAGARPKMYEGSMKSAAAFSRLPPT